MAGLTAATEASGTSTAASAAARTCFSDPCNNTCVFSPNSLRRSSRDIFASFGDVLSFVDQRRIPVSENSRRCRRNHHVGHTEHGGVKSVHRGAAARRNSLLV